VVAQLLKKQRWSSCDSAFTAGRADASQEQTDAESFDVLEQADGFRNYLKAEYTISSEEMLIDKAQLMTLTVPQMTVLGRNACVKYQL
jgi:catalase (peroxidase I)